jgi:nucleoside-diphosphate-sugar epimerase
MCKNVVDVCIENKIKLIFISTADVFSECPGVAEAPFKEDAHRLPRGTFGLAKYLCEIMIETSWKSQGLDFCVLRTGRLFDVASRTPKFLFSFIEKALSGMAINTHRYRNGFPVIDLLCVEDLAEAVLLSIEKNCSGYIHTGAGITLTTRDIAEFIIKKTDSESNLGIVDIDDLFYDTTLDISKTGVILGWKPSASAGEKLLELAVSQSV